MPHLDTDTVRLHYQTHGQGPRHIIFVHGNLGCLQWMDLVWPWLSPELQVHAYDWRGCGESEKPPVDADYSAYSLAHHARDLLAFMDALGLDQVDLITHSTGSLIADIAILEAPRRFGRVLALAPVTPRSLPFDESSLGLFQAMKADRAIAEAGLATAAPPLFEPDSLQPGEQPRYRAETTPEQRRCFETLVDNTRKLSDGIWFGIPRHLDRLYHGGELAGRMGELQQPRLILWGEHDLWIPRADVEAMAEALPDCSLRVISGIGHAMNLEAPQAFAEQANGFFT